MLYIICTSFMYTVFLALLSALCLLPKIGFSSQWGKLLGTLSQTSTAQTMGIYVNIPIAYNIVSQYTPLRAMALSGLLMWLVCVFLGMLIFAVSGAVNKTLGLALASGFALTDYVVHVFMLSVWPFYISPVSWAGLQNLSGGAKPSVSYAILVLTGLIVLLVCWIACSASSSRSLMFDNTQEVWHV